MEDLIIYVDVVCDTGLYALSPTLFLGLGTLLPSFLFEYLYFCFFFCGWLWFIQTNGVTSSRFSGFGVFGLTNSVCVAVFEDGTLCTLCTDEIVSGPGGATSDKTVTGLSDSADVRVSENFESFSSEMLDARVVVSIRGFGNAVLLSSVLVDTCGKRMSSGLDKSDEIFVEEFEIE